MQQKEKERVRRGATCSHSSTNTEETRGGGGGGGGGKNMETTYLPMEERPMEARPVSMEERPMEARPAPFWRPPGRSERVPVLGIMEWRAGFVFLRRPPAAAAPFFLRASGAPKEERPSPTVFRWRAESVSRRRGIVAAHSI